MLGTKLLIILVPILLAEAQNNVPRRLGLARRPAFFRPGGRPGLFTVVTSVPVASTTTEKIEIIPEPNPTVAPPKESVISHIPDVTTPPISNPIIIKPTELTIVYPENYKPVSTYAPPVQSTRRGPVRLPLNRPRPSMGPNRVPITPPPPPPPAPIFTKPVESVTVNVVATVPTSNEVVMIQTTEKQPEIQTASPRPVYIETPISEEPISKKPILEVPISEQPISEQPISEQPISEQPISEQPISEQPMSEQPISEQPISEQPISEQPISEQPISEQPISEEPISQEPISQKPISEEPIFEEPISEEPAFKEPISEKPVSEIPLPAIVEPSINRPINWHVISPVAIQVPTVTQRPLTTRSVIAISPAAPVTQKPIEIVQPTIEIKPNMDDFIPPSSASNSIVVGGNKPSRQPAMIWHPVQQKPRTTSVPTTTEVYIPSITQKPKRPVSPAKPWSQPVDNTYTVNRLHDYICKSMDGYESILNKCDAYIECKSNLAFQNTCPDGLHFNPAAQWPEYPCGYPTEVQCRSQDLAQEPQPSDQCPHRYGFYPLPGSDCGQYIMCQEGLATVMSCPPGLAFSSLTSSCDWPANVPGCSPLIFREYSCPPPTVDEYGKQIYDDAKFRYGKSCKQYVACHKGNPRLLSCDAGMSFDEEYETCVDADQVMDCVQ